MAKERWVVAALLIGTALGSPLRAQGTGSVSGRVVDSTTQQPVANAQVQVVGTQPDLAEKAGMHERWIREREAPLLDG